ncbi:hypothetical protein BD309DRAFT_994977 [Dichomitus squalens]|nr:hypothetical protein BD309DRAFT_994977 [Dichomitus squalens]
MSVSVSRSAEGTELEVQPLPCGFAQIFRISRKARGAKVASEEAVRLRVPLVHPRELGNASNCTKGAGTRLSSLNRSEESSCSSGVLSIVVIVVIVVSGLLELDVDVLVYIVEMLRPACGLCSLSVACRWLRTLCMPVLFENCTVTVRGPITTPRFLPPTLWPFVRTLHLMDHCPDLRSMRHPGDRLRFATDRLICGVISSAFLKDALRAMPRLRSVRVGFLGKEEHGLGWDAIDAILSASQLREFTITTSLFSPREAPGREIPLDHFARLTTFHYARHTSHFGLHGDVQRESLAVVVEILNLSLERLRLPSDLAPIATLASLPWPRLRELKLDGAYPPNLDVPLIYVISRMPNLRKLALLFSLPWDGQSQKQAVWPRECSLDFLFPDLEELAISYPDPEDCLYSHLPPTLRRLSLQCCPHHCIHVWKPGTSRYWRSPIPHASHLWRILSNVKAPLLQHLQLEYITDHADGALLESIATSFPTMSSLEIHRFRDGENAKVHIVRT